MGKKKKAEAAVKSEPSVPSTHPPHPGECDHGTGALCAEAQADGVPCFEIGRDCETCGRARKDRE